MTPIRQILEKHSKQIGKAKWLFSDKFELVEKEILALNLDKSFPGIEFTINYSSDTEREIDPYGNFINNEFRPPDYIV